MDSDDEWRFHDESFDLDDGDDTFQNSEVEGLQLRGISVSSKFENELREYVLSFTDRLLIQKVNNMFQAEYNNTQTALQLCQYYYARPNLQSYTIKTELNRLSYTFIIDNETVLISADDIEEWYTKSLLPFLSDQNETRQEYLVPDMLVRCSNQSLLADVIEALTTDDWASKCRIPLIRNRFHASSIATKCRFVVDLRIPETNDHASTRHVQVDVTLNIRIPLMQNNSSSDDKLDLACIRLLITFSPEPHAPTVSYSAVSIHPLIDLNCESDCTKLHHAAVTLERHFDILDDTVHDDVQSVANARDMIRDNFIKTMTNTHFGFTSALREIETATNVSRKLGYLKSITASLPTLTAAASEIANAAAGDHESSLIHTSLENNKFFHLHQEPVKLENDTQRFLKVQPSSSNSNHQVSHSRPPPVLGNLILSGLKTLAKAATLPDQPNEEEEADCSHKSPSTSPFNPIQNPIVSTIERNRNLQSNKELIDGWQDDDLFLEDDHIPKITETTQLHEPSVVQNNIWLRAREDLDVFETKKFWGDAYEVLMNASKYSDQDSEEIMKATRVRYQTRAERLGLKTIS